MIIIACVDDRMGMQFNGRRQSRDRLVYMRIAGLAAGGRLWMNEDSAELFSWDEDKISVAGDFLSRAQSGDYCFIEDDAAAGYSSEVEKIILYKWNRAYPGDVFFPLPLEGWKLEQVQEFPGYSHEKITEEVYVK